MKKQNPTRSSGRPNTNDIILAAITSLHNANVALSNANVALSNANANLVELAKGQAQATTFNDALVTLLSNDNFAKAIGGVVDRVVPGFRQAARRAQAS